MATKSGLTWQKPPSAELLPRLTGYSEDLSDAVLELADYLVAKMASYARVHALWTDRTGAARQGLRGFAIRQAAEVILYLVTSVGYGVHLELGTIYMAPRPIIMPTLQAHGAEIMRAYRALVRAA